MPLMWLRKVINVDPYLDSYYLKYLTMYHISTSQCHVFHVLLWYFYKSCKVIVRYLLRFHIPFMRLISWKSQYLPKYILLKLSGLITKTFFSELKSGKIYDKSIKYCQSFNFYEISWDMKVNFKIFDLIFHKHLHKSMCVKSKYISSCNKIHFIAGKK